MEYDHYRQRTANTCKDFFDAIRPMHGDGKAVKTLADMIHVDYRTLYPWFRGDRIPSLDKALDLANAAGYDAILRRKFLGGNGSD